MSAQYLTTHLLERYQLKPGSVTLPRCNGIIIVCEGLMLVDIVGYPYTHKFSSHKRLTNEWIVLHLMQQTSYPWINVPMNQQNFDNPQTLATTNKFKYEFTVVSRWTLSIFRQVYSKKSRSNLLSWSHVVYLVAILWPLPSLVQWLSPESSWSLLIFKSHSQISS